jgi:hypothetical protein
MAVERVAQVELDAQRHLAGDDAAQHAEHQPRESGAGDRQCQHHQLVTVMVVDRVDSDAGEGRDEDGGAERSEGEHE